MAHTPGAGSGEPRTVPASPTDHKCAETRKSPGRRVRRTFAPVRPCVFLDRDDTLIACRAVVPDGDLGDPSLVRLAPGALEACRRLKRAGFALVVVTNQGGVARGRYSIQDVERVHRRVNELLAGMIDAFRFCPFHPRGTVPDFAAEHPWRKPQPGMLLDASERMGLDLSRSWMIGDAPRDMEAGHGAGCRTVLITNGRPPEAGAAGGEGQGGAEFVVRDLAEASALILRESGLAPLVWDGGDSTPRFAGQEAEPEAPTADRAGGAQEVGAALKKESGSAEGEGAGERGIRRLLVVMPTWVGDAVMATPACRLLREAMPGALLGALVRRPVDEVLAGSELFDDIIVAPAGGLMAPKVAAQRVRMGRFDGAVILPNSFSSALTARLAGVRRRFGYDRDGRGLLLTDRIPARKRRDVEPYARSGGDPEGWAPVPAVDYYLQLARFTLERLALRIPPAGPLELGVTDAEEREAARILHESGLEGRRFALLNPGGNNEAKRWPAERFAQLGAHLIDAHGMAIAVNGSPGEKDLVEDIAARAFTGSRGGAPAIALPGFGTRVGSLKGIVRRASLMVTNDTGPRHIGAAFGVPVVTLFGPTDHRWTTIASHARGREIELLADPTLPEEEVSNDHPERCRVDRIAYERVAEAVEELLRGEE